jgi:hypothetical protein
MTQDEIMEMARQAHFDSTTWVDIFADNPTVGDVRNYLVAFANLVTAKEREACAKVCEGINSLEDYYGERIELACVEAIRARGEQA